MMAVSSKPPIIPSTMVMGFDSSQRFRFRAVAKVTIVDNGFLISRRKEEDGARFGGLEFELDKLRFLECSSRTVADQSRSRGGFLLSSVVPFMVSRKPEGGRRSKV
ncbi:uncharacterized protein LOC110698818 [Chenopodium quinoa]|uniref:uncharacterized protein LOC110698818 n=1 Tax=Chenopodium quinoa TaxID=63459 RepID=UPI000B78C0C8|nr:uncharacterized protein LOC110698818 [Chenopodium quinoa]